MKTLTCIVCPMGRSLTVEEGSLEADGFPAPAETGNRRLRGAVYAREEIRAPRRIVTSTCRIQGEGPPGRGGAGGEDAAQWTFSPEIPRRLPVKATSSCPRKKIPALPAEICRAGATLPITSGNTVLSGRQGSGINAAAARTLP